VPEFLQLKVRLPYSTLIDRSDVSAMVAETQAGAFGILPHRLDCVAALTPGILSYRTGSPQEHYIAVDEGVLVKTGLLILVAVHHAVSGSELASLHSLVEEQFKSAHNEAKAMNATLIKLETGFIRRLTDFEH